MTEYNPPLLSIAILDFKRPVELDKLLTSLEQNLRIPAKIVYCHDGPLPDYALEHYRKGRFDTIIGTNKSEGCGIKTRQLFQACMTPYILYCQVDQWLVREFGPNDFQACQNALSRPDVFYVDLAGNQGRGNPSERALLMWRKDYLEMPDIDSVIGGPGPYADHKWTEQYLQEYMAKNNLYFARAEPLFFADNGKCSYRSYPCSGETLHFTDEKTLFILKPLKQRYDFPNLKLNDEEWKEVLEGRWPVEGKIPEADKPHSFKVW